MPTVCACLIVRNEEQNLPRCLGSLREAVDDIVVVDTGSTDNTVAIAEEFGARTGHFEWCDDFAAARNFALTLVESDWMLVIDADDELKVERGFAMLFAHVGDATIVRVPIEDADKSEAVQSAPRLFRMAPGMLWERPIHEELVTPRRQYAVADGYIRYVHYGYTSETAPKKLERNIRLLRKHLGQQPENVGSMLFLSRELAQIGRYEEGLAAAQDLLNAEPQGPTLVDAYAVYAWNALALERYREVEDITREARRLNAASMWTEYMKAVAHLEQGNRTKAREAVNRACNMEVPEGTLLGLNYILEKRFQLAAALQ